MANVAENDGRVSLGARRKVVRSKLPIGFSGGAVAENEYAIVLLSRDILVSLLQAGTVIMGEWVGAS